MNGGRINDNSDEEFKSCEDLVKEGEKSRFFFSFIKKTFDESFASNYSRFSSIQLLMKVQRMVFFQIFSFRYNYKTQF